MICIEEIKNLIIKSVKFKRFVYVSLWAAKPSWRTVKIHTMGVKTSWQNFNASFHLSVIVFLTMRMCLCLGTHVFYSAVHYAHLFLSQNCGHKLRLVTATPPGDCVTHWLTTQVVGPVGILFLTQTAYRRNKFLCNSCACFICFVLCDNSECVVLEQVDCWQQKRNHKNCVYISRWIYYTISCI